MGIIKVRGNIMTPNPQTEKKKEPKEPLEMTLGKMAENGILKEKFNEKINQMTYGLTNKGFDDVTELLKKDRVSRIFLMRVFQNIRNTDANDALFFTAKYFKENFKINFFKDIVKAKRNGEIKGIEIKNENKFIKLYDVIS